MNNIDVQVNPSPYVKPTVYISNLRINVMNVVLFNSVSVQAVLLDADNNYIDTKIILIKDFNHDMKYNFINLNIFKCILNRIKEVPLFKI